MTLNGFSARNNQSRKISYLLEFDETPRFWYPCVALVAWIDFNSWTVEIRPSKYLKNLPLLFFPFLPLFSSIRFFLSPLSSFFPPFPLHRIGPITRMDQVGKIPPTFLCSSLNMTLVSFSHFLFISFFSFLSFSHSFLFLILLVLFSLFGLILPDFLLSLISLFGQILRYFSNIFLFS